jgi:8-oxo-dGTP pyrophosphatase MutT (NUDIX family)
MTIGYFLGGIAALLWAPESEQYLLLRRAGERDFQAGAWECVTGRVDQGEGFETALQREIFEETGLNARIEFIIGTTHFFRGQVSPENELLGVIYGCSIVGGMDVRIQEEHSEFRWATSSEAEAMLPEGHWLRKVIPKADRLRRSLPPELAEAFHREGFEI